ncbi:MAG: hypothetical protein R3D26_20540 [Cyanobacteriota/Melainabacteria group bacterium]
MNTKKLEIFCDFDGTITVGDTVDLLLEKLALPEWEALELWQKGEISSGECADQADRPHSRGLACGREGPGHCGSRPGSCIFCGLVQAAEDRIQYRQRWSRPSDQKLLTRESVCRCTMVQSSD